MLTTLFSVFLAVLAAATRTHTWQDPAAIAAAAWSESASAPLVAAEPNLFVIDLPAGEMVGFDVDAFGWTGNSVKLWSSRAAIDRLAAQDQPRALAEADPRSYWLDRGDEDGPYVGVHFQGAGVGKTRIRPGSADATITVDRHPGLVRFTGVSAHTKGRAGGGKPCAIFFGREHRSWGVTPEFKLEFWDSETIAEAPSAGGSRAVWGLFGYQADVHLRNVRLDHTQGTEHALYWHGYAKEGLRAERVTIPGSGSQGLKVRNSPSETLWVRGASSVFIDCTIENTMQDWTWRGPGAIVIEGGGGNILALRVLLKGGAGERAKLFMVDDAGGDFYSATNGTVGRGYANGHVIIRDSGFFAGPGTESYTPMVRVCGNGPTASTRFAARSVTISGSAAYGAKVQVQLGNIPQGKTSVTGCNTPQIARFAASIGMATAVEAVFTLSSRVAKVSEDLVR